jgi:CHAT domain-containing protein
VGQFQRLITGRDEGINLAARELYDVLLKPAEEQLARKAKLIIVPDGILWRLPFAALQPADDRYLIEQAAISYAPSLTSLREIRKPRQPQNIRERNSRAPTSRSPSPLTLAAFENPLLSLRRLQPIQTADKKEANTTPVEPGSAPAIELALEPAPKQAAEYRERQKLFAVYGDAQSRVYAGANASEERARIEAGRPNVVLHFAVPTLLDDAVPMFSFTALSALSEQEAENGLLQTWEIMNLNSQARLVVLSGSEMSGGRVGPGDAVAALRGHGSLPGRRR